MIRFFIVAICAIIASNVVAMSSEENLLGLPTPSDPNHPGSVVLHGGGRVTDDVFDRFIELAGGKNASIVFVPSAGFRVSDYLGSEEKFLAALSRRYSGWTDLKSSGAVRNFTFLYTDDPHEADNPAFVKPLETATGVWFSGGYQSRLNYRYVGVFPERTRFQQLLRQVLVRGGVVGGTSAGTAALPEIMTMWEDRVSETAPARAVAAHGLGLFDKAIVEQHFDGRGGRLERFTGLLRDNERLDELTERPGSGSKMMGIAVEEPAALVVQGNRMSVLGQGSVHLFLKSNRGRTLTWHELDPGESAILRRSAQLDIAIMNEELRLERSQTATK